MIHLVDSPTTFFIQNNLEQLVHIPTRNPGSLGDEPNILDLFLTSYPSSCTVKLFPLLGSSDLVLSLQIFSKKGPSTQRRDVSNEESQVQGQ
ncbi:UNVERIFIED_CONTAM: hypothetical protein RMT77_011808 [Armadillidium vulgare]